MSEKSSEVRIEMTVKAPVRRAFQAFTEQCDAWWPRVYRLGEVERTDVRVEPGVGGRWYEVTADGSEHDWGRVLAWDAPDHLTLSWQITPDFRPEPDRDKASRVDVRFTADGPDATKVTLVHNEFERHGEGWQKAYEGVSHEAGWPGIMTAYSVLAAA